MKVSSGVKPLEQVGFTWATMIRSKTAASDPDRHSSFPSIRIDEDQGLREVTMRRDDSSTPSGPGILKRTSVTQVTRVVESSQNYVPSDAPSMLASSGSRGSVGSAAGSQDLVTAKARRVSMAPTSGVDPDNVVYKRITAVRRMSKAHQDAEINVEEKAVIEITEDIVPFTKKSAGGIPSADSGTASGVTSPESPQAPPSATKPPDAEQTRHQ